MKKVTSSIAILWIVLLFGLSSTFALEKPTHEAINEKIALGSFNGFSLDTYLKNNLGFIDGTIEEVNGQKVFEWLKLGGKKEDEPMYTRSLNHFHNPLKEPWSSAGLKGTSKSSILWAHDQGLAGFLTGGNFAWKNVREYYYTALTGKDFSGAVIAYTQAEKEIYYGATFRGIGQLMHLVEDASVPAHTRDDSHVAGYHYEKAVDKLRDKLDPVFTNAIANPITFDSSILSLPPNPLAPIPIAKIFDTDSYNDTNPDPNVTVGNTIGLSEYANANFVSEGLISANFQDFPYPRIQDTTIIRKSITSSSGTYTRQYYLKNCCGETNSGQGYLLSTVDLLDYWRQKYPLLSAGLPKIPGLDDNVYKDYASLLIPRAVGYSAGLLDYFFRGTLEIIMPDSYIYSITDGSQTPQQFTRITAKVRNSTPDSIPGEEIQGCDTVQQNCIIQAVARYKKRTDYQPDLSTDPPTTSSREADYSYSVSVPIAITSLSSTTPAEFTFDFTNSPIPAGITDLYLHVIFKGTLGNETDIAIAVGIKDLNEPQHFSIWNATDRFYLDGVLRTANEIRNDPSLLARVDFNGNGIANEAGEPYIDPYDVTTEIAFYPSGVTPTIYNATFTPLPSGRYGRIIILTDMPTFYTLIHRNSTNPPDDMTANFLFSGVTNQDINGTFQNTQVITFRGIIQHTWSAYARCYPNCTGISTAPWPAPSNTNPYPISTMYP